MKNFLLLSIVASFVLGFSACGEGETVDKGDWTTPDPTPPTVADIVGIWEPIHYAYWEKTNGEITDQGSEDVVPEDGYSIYTFNSDGTGTTIFREGDGYQDVHEMTWSLSEMTLSITFAGETDAALLIIEEISSTKAVVFDGGTEVKDGITYEWREIYTYKKKAL